MSVIKFDKWANNAIFVQMMGGPNMERINIIKELRTEFGVGLKEAKNMLENGALFPNAAEGILTAVIYMGRISNLHARGLLKGFQGFTVGMWEKPLREEPYGWSAADF